MELKELKELFKARYGGAEEDIRIFSAAGRVNLIGEHIDYNGGKVFPAALNLRCLVLARVNNTSTINMSATTTPLTATIDANKLGEYREIEWGSYQAGVMYFLALDGYNIVGCDLLYDADVPFGSGLSSSAAIEVATALTMCSLSNTAKGIDTPIDRVYLAQVSQKAENEYCGVNCGIMDQFASSMGCEGKAILLDCKTLQYQYIPIELGDYRLVIANCNKKRSLQDSKYNERRDECEKALKILKKKYKDITCLADLSVSDFEEYAYKLPKTLLKRARHVVTECARVDGSVKALKNNDILMFGSLLNQSHYSLRDDYEVTGKELDTLSHLSRSFAGCIGSRMTGAGFGGCVVSLVHKDSVADFISEVGEKYLATIGYSASFYNTSIGNGAYELKD